MNVEDEELAVRYDASAELLLQKKGVALQLDTKVQRHPQHLLDVLHPVNTGTS